MRSYIRFWGAGVMGFVLGSSTHSLYLGGVCEGISFVTKQVQLGSFSAGRSFSFIMGQDQCRRYVLTT